MLGRHAERRFTVVGVFRANGSALESEVWVPGTMLADAYQRRVISSVCLRLNDPSALAGASAYVKGPTVQLEGKSETQYYDDLATTTREIVMLTSVLIGIMAVGAVFAVANTMYAAVDGRRREIAMLRAIGFDRGRVIGALVSESLLLSVLACACGLAASLLLMNLMRAAGMRQDFLSQRTWTVLAYDLRVTPGIIGASLGLAVLVGAFGALAPAVRAARFSILDALRKA